MHNPAHLPGFEDGQKLGYLGCVNLALEICTVTYYKNCMVKSLEPIDQIIYLGFRSVKKERKNGTDYHGQEKKTVNINYTGPRWGRKNGGEEKCDL